MTDDGKGASDARLRTPRRRSPEGPGFDRKILDELENYHREGSAVPRALSIVSAGPLSRRRGAGRGRLASAAGGRAAILFFHATSFAFVESQVSIVAALREDVRITFVVVSDFMAHLLWRALDALKVPNLRDRVRFVLNPRLGGPWVRDRFLVFVGSSGGGCSFAQSGEQAPGGAPGAVLSGETGPAWEGTDFFVRDGGVIGLPGGDLTSDERFVYVGIDSVRRYRRDASGALAMREGDAVREIERITGKKAVVLPGPDLHNDRYHLPLGATPYGRDTSLLADPVGAVRALARLTARERRKSFREMTRTLRENRLGRQEGLEKKIWDFLNVEERLVRHPAILRAVQKLRDVQRVLEGHGIAVMRVPALSPAMLPWAPLGFYYSNAILDRGSALVPRYFVPSLDRGAEAIYRRAGYRVTFVPGIVAGVYGGGPRCLAQVVSFSSRPRGRACGLRVRALSGF